MEPEINFPAHEVNEHLHVLSLTDQWWQSSSISSSNLVTSALGFPPVQIGRSQTNFYFPSLYLVKNTCHTPLPDLCLWGSWCHGSSWLASSRWHSCPWTIPTHTCSQQKLPSPWWYCHGQLFSNPIHSQHVFWIFHLSAQFIWLQDLALDFMPYLICLFSSSSNPSHPLHHHPHHHHCPGWICPPHQELQDTLRVWSSCCKEVHHCNPIADQRRRHL